MRDLGTLGSKGYDRRPHMFAWEINDRGVIAGAASYTEGGNEQSSDAFLWREGKLTRLPFCGENEAWSYSWPSDLNERGQVVGSSLCGPSFEDGHAVLWQNGKLRDLGTLGGSSSSAIAISERGQVVGQWETDGGPRGFVWQNGLMADLPVLGSDGSTFARSINDRNQIVGTSGGHAVLWTLRATLAQVAAQSLGATGP